MLLEFELCFNDALPQIAFVEIQLRLELLIREVLALQVGHDSAHSLQVDHQRVAGREVAWRPERTPQLKETQRGFPLRLVGHLPSDTT